MYSTVKTAMIDGIHTIPICVEVDICEGLPVFNMVGDLSSEVREAKERVRTALHNCGIQLPPKRITINLSPGNIHKNGTGFDLAIAVGIMCALGIVDENLCCSKIFVGELNLSGQILPVNGVLPIVSEGQQYGIFEFVVPTDNLMEARLVGNTVSYGMSHLNEIIGFLNGEECENKECFKTENKTQVSHLDFSEVNGQQYLKRACEVAASGMHNILMIGPPGAGKTMISERMATILPELTEEEKLELSKIYSICGLLNKTKELLSERPFRNPHHTITKTGLTGGGIFPHPGEISLAHHGVLFLDELTEFQKSTLELLRQPLEEHEIRLVRANGAVTYPASFLLLAAMNPCSCGYYPDMQKCRCSPATLKRYFEKISQPLIDRIDICVEAAPLSYQELTGGGKNECSKDIRERVVKCHKRQHERFRQEYFQYNSQIPAARLAEYCSLGKKQKTYMENIYAKLSLTGRTYHKILRVARTLADMDEEEQIQMKHLNEAVCYRSMTEKYWGG